LERYLVSPDAFWISPDGTVHAIAAFGHDSFAREQGFQSARHAILSGWIRGFANEGYLAFHIGTLDDENALELIEDFAFTHGPSYGRWMAVIETENPTDPKIQVMDRDLLDLGIKEAVAYERRIARLRPFGMSGLGLHFEGERERKVRTRKGTRTVRERLWYDSDQDEVIVERFEE